MLKELLQAWRGRNTLRLMMDQLDQMLAHDRWMFQQAADTYWRQQDWKEVEAPLYGRDKQVNELERSIRREVVRHLTLHSPGEDVPACLVLMSVVKDAERIGDYCKNIFEVGKVFQYEYTAPRYLEPLKDVGRSILEMFDRTREAFRESNSEKARSVTNQFEAIRRKCDLIIEQLLRQKEELPTDEAVSYSLMCRHMKRVSAHLANIATSVFAPIEDLDFMDERLGGADSNSNNGS